MKECDWMAKKRIYEVAKEVGVDNKVVVQKAKDLGFDVKNHMSSIDDAQAAKLKSSFQNSAPAKKNNIFCIFAGSPPSAYRGWLEHTPTTPPLFPPLPPP